jgi:hypothetical protein
MCLTIQKVNGKTIQIAEQDIVCYKYVFAGKKKWMPAYSPLPREYGYNKILTAEKYIMIQSTMGVIPSHRYSKIKSLTLNEGPGEMVIHEGFHAYLRDDYVPYTGDFYKRAKICVIPKGTEICYGINDDIVAVNMIVFRNMFQYLKYKLKKSFGKSC